MATYKGAAFLSLVEALGTRFYSVALTSRATPNNPGDTTNFELDATTATVSFVFGTSTTGATPPAAPNKLDIILYDARTLTIVDSVQLTSPADGAVASLNLTDTGTGAGNANALIGCMRIFVRAIKDDAAGGIGNYNIHSDDPAIQASGQNLMGLVRVNPTTLSIAVTAGGTPHAWPDTQQVSLTLSHGTKTNVAARTFSIRMRKSDLLAMYKGPTATNSGTDTIRQLTTPFDVDFAYPQDLTSVLAEAVLNTAELAPTSDAAFTWIKIPLGAVGRVSDTTIRSTIFTVDPRLTITPTRTSALAVVNFGFHTITGTFTLTNARGTLLTNALAAAKRDVVVVSRDITTSADQRSISASLSPSAAGVYTLPSFVYRGPATLSNRGVGLDGDTTVPQPATDVQRAVGRPKAIKTTIVGGSPTAPIAISGTFVNLSDLLDLDNHPQKTSVLIQDSDPYASPGSGETVSFTIGSDALNLFAFVGDVNRQPVPSTNVTLTLLDPDGVSSGTPQVRQTQMGVNNGWTTSSANFNVIAPAGTWKARVSVDLNATGAQGNYGNGTTTAPADLTAKEQVINFISSYSANRAVAIHTPPTIVPGQVITIITEYRHQNGTRENFDTDPSLRIYKVDPLTGADTDVLAPAVMTRVGGLNVWTRGFTAPTTEADLMIEVRASFLSSGVEAVEPLSVKKVPPPVLDAVGLALTGKISFT